jgi:hypothetical protein
MGFSFTYPSPLPSTKGWGPGWPNCQKDKIVPHPIFQGGVRKEIAELVNLLVAEMARRGYGFDGNDSWGFACRATKGGSGTTPSFHSWGLALDFNAGQNGFYDGAMKNSDIANNNKWIVGLMRAYGFFWLGPAIEDTMHFHFAGSPADARAMTKKARRKLGPSFTVKGKRFKKLGTALKRLKALLAQGARKVTVKRR